MKKEAEVLNKVPESAKKWLKPFVLKVFLLASLAFGLLQKPDEIEEE